MSMKNVLLYVIALLFDVIGLFVATNEMVTWVEHGFVLFIIPAAAILPLCTVMLLSKRKAANRISIVLLILMALNFLLFVIVWSQTTRPKWLFPVEAAIFLLLLIGLILLLTKQQVILEGKERKIVTVIQTAIIAFVLLFCAGTYLKTIQDLNNDGLVGTGVIERTGPFGMTKHYYFDWPDNHPYEVRKHGVFFNFAPKYNKGDSIKVIYLNEPQQLLLPLDLIPSKKSFTKKIETE